MRWLGALTVAVAALLIPQRATALPVTVDFDSFSDEEILDTQLPGLTFTNAVVAESSNFGAIVDPFQFPARSPLNVVLALDSNGPIQIDFASAVSSVGGYFTYFGLVTLQAFNGMGNLVGSATSQYSTNNAVTPDAGSAPNELLTVASLSIAYVIITGDMAGGSFTLDDLQYETAAATETPVPEPATLTLLLMGGGAMLARRRRRA